VKRTRFVALAAALSGVPRQLRAQGATPPIRYGGTTNDTAAQPYYAQELGFFRRAGLNVEITTLGNGATVAQAVAGGALDMGGHNLVGLATAIARNIPFALLAGGGVYSSNAPTTALAVAKNAPFRTAKDLEGKTVGVPALRDLTSAAAAAWLEQNGADLSTIKFVEIPFVEAGAALERGTVQASMIAEPSLSIATHGPARLFGKAFDAISREFMITATFASTDWIRKNPYAARRMAQVLYETARWANNPANRAQSGEILAAAAKIDRDVIRTMTRATYALSADVRLVQPPLDIAYKFKIIDRAMTTSELLGK
jgi:ABC-type nitrate/sulfonate/bicarbonate transport system substrate-binding protein